MVPTFVLMSQFDPAFKNMSITSQLEKMFQLGLLKKVTALMACHVSICLFFQKIK